MPDKKLAAILITGESRERSQQALDALCAQSIPDEMEIVVIDLVGPEIPRLIGSGCIPINYQVLPGISWAHARALAVGFTNAPIVAFIEDHVFTSPNWAKALVLAYQGPWAAVGYAFQCANPETYIARGVLLAEYGLWGSPAVSGAANILPCGNVSYSRDALLSMGDELENLLTPDFVIHERFKQLGWGLYFESEAVVAHQSFVSLRNTTIAAIVFCRLLASHRAKTQNWNWPKRIMYAIATPFISPPTAFIRLFTSIQRRRADRKDMLIYSPILICKSFSAAAGESIGYLSRGKNTDRNFSELELNTRRI